MNLWWNNIETVNAFNTWAVVIALAGATLTFISMLQLWRSWLDEGAARLESSLRWGPRRRALAQSVLRRLSALSARGER